METVVSITGRLGNNVELRRTNSEVDYASFRLATNRRMMRGEEWVDGPTTWVTVKSFRQLATNVALSLRKGQAVVVVGRLEVEEWVTTEGVQRESAVLYAHAIGHDLNWGISMLHRLERKRTEPAPPDAAEQDANHAVPEHDMPEHDMPEHDMPEHDMQDPDEPAAVPDDAADLATAESSVARIGVPVG